jgi:ABC-type glutathione transport system ATPase component
VPVTHLIVGPSGSGKSFTIEQLIAAEKLAADNTVTIWGIQGTASGSLAGADRTVGADQATQLLTEVLTVIDERTACGRVHEPTAAEPRIKLVIDDAEPVLRDYQAAGLLRRLAVTARAAAVETVVAVSDLAPDSWPFGLRGHYTAGQVTICDRRPRTNA